MTAKYFKPRSLTWWASFALLAAGLLLAVSNSTGTMPVVAELIRQLFGSGVEPAVLVNTGLVGIGLRGAIG